MRWRRLILTCRSTKEGGAKRRRPAVYWPDDALARAESLLGIDLGRGRSGGRQGAGDDADEEMVVLFPSGGAGGTESGGGASAGRFWERVATHADTPEPADLRAWAEAGRVLLARWHRLPAARPDAAFDAFHDWIYGEWITAIGAWVNDRTHGLQLKAHSLKTSAPSSIESIEKYLGSSMIRGIGSLYAKRPVKHFRKDVFDVGRCRRQCLRAAGDAAAAGRGFAGAGGAGAPRCGCGSDRDGRAGDVRHHRRVKVPLG